ncbi:MAG: hypothetical protein WBE25_17030 [Xanthobacteraceae bacterium]
MDDTMPVIITNGDLRRLYAKLNAHEAIVRVLIHTFVDSAESPPEMFEQIRSVTMDEGDVFEVAKNSPDREFAEQGRLETLRFIAETFDAVKAGRDSSTD